MMQNDGDVDPRIWETFSLDELRSLHWADIPDSGKRSFERWVDPRSNHLSNWQESLYRQTDVDTCFEFGEEISRIKSEMMEEMIVIEKAGALWRHRRDNLCTLIALIPWGLSSWFIIEWGTWAEHHKGLFAFMNESAAYLLAFFWFLALFPMRDIVDDQLTKSWPKRVTPEQYIEWAKKHPHIHL